MSTLLSYCFYLGLLLAFGGEYIMTKLNFAPGCVSFAQSLQQWLMSARSTALVRWMKENNIAVMVVLFICNWLSTQLMSTGAFEVRLLAIPCQSSVLMLLVRV